MGTKLQIVAMLAVAVWVAGFGSTGSIGAPVSAGSPDLAPFAWDGTVERTTLTGVSGAEPDTSLLGVRIFAQRGCTNCHSIGEGVVVGPDLEGVTDRRSFDWFRGLVTKPDSMLSTDPSAIQLRAAYAVSMPDLDIDEDEARALYAFLEDPSTFLTEDPAGSESTLSAGGCPRCQSGACTQGGCKCAHCESGECHHEGCGECKHCESGECPHEGSGDCPGCASGECAHCGSGEGAGDGPKMCGHHGEGKMCGHHGSMSEGHSPMGKMGGCGHKRGSQQVPSS